MGLRKPRPVVHTMQAPNLPVAKEPDNRTYAEKAVDHVLKAEEWQAEVLAREYLAEEPAQKELRARRDRPDMLKYYVSQELANDYWYKRAVSNRNANQTQATMYALMALLKEK